MDDYDEYYEEEQAELEVLLALNPDDKAISARLREVEGERDYADR